MQAYGQILPRLAQRTGQGIVHAQRLRQTLRAAQKALQKLMPGIQGGTLLQLLLLGFVPVAGADLLSSAVQEAFQLRLVNGLFQIAVRLQGDGGLQVFLVGIAADKQNVDIREMLPEQAGQFDPVELWHPDIAQQHVRLHLQGNLIGRLAVSGGTHLGEDGRNTLQQPFPGGLLVLGD